MTHHQKTIKLFTEGKKREAYNNYLKDENRLDNISFEKFCIGYDKMIGRSKTYNIITNKWTNSYEA